MKLNHLFAIAAAGSFALVACDKPSTTAMEEKATDAKAAVDKKMEEVKDAAKEKGADASAKIDKAAEDAKVVDAAKDAATPTPPVPAPPAPDAPAVPDAPK